MEAGARSSVLDRIRAHQHGEAGAVPFSKALSEMSAGNKVTHWIWYIWPTLRGVRRTMRPELELPSFDCARDFLRDPELGTNLVTITEVATAKLKMGITPSILFGAMHMYDAPKFHEACTLFFLAARAEGNALQAAVFLDGLVYIAKEQASPGVIAQLRTLGLPEAQLQIHADALHVPAAAPVSSDSEPATATASSLHTLASS